MADEGVHDVRELNRQLIRGWGHVGFYKPGFMSTRHMGCHLFLGTQRDLYKGDITRGRFSTVIFSTTHHCNIVATLF